MYEDLVDVLIELHRFQMSVSLNTFEVDQLKIEPGTNDEDLIHALEYFFHDLREILPGICESCQLWSPKRTVAYWGSEPAFCHLCLDQILDYLNETQNYPPAMIPDRYETYAD